MKTQRERHDETAAWVDCLLPKSCERSDEVQPNGNMLRTSMEGDGDRYRFDRVLQLHGFQQYDTDQDAWYYGVWVHLSRWQVVSYAEGDAYITTCPTADAMRAELARIAEFHGDPPPAFRVIDMETGGVTHHYRDRPNGDDVTGGAT